MKKVQMVEFIDVTKIRGDSIASEEDEANSRRKVEIRKDKSLAMKETTPGMVQKDMAF